MCSQALTAAERKKRYIDKMKANGKFDEFKQQNAENAQKRRSTIKAGLETLPKNVRTKIKRLKREYTRRKVAECRQRKKHGGSVSVTSTSSVPSTCGQTEDGSYKTSSALSKAVGKIRKSMPKTVRKTKQAVGKYLKSLEPTDLHDIMVDVGTIKPKKSRGLSSSDIDLVQSFYERDDISRMSPNVKDCRKFVDPISGAKEYKQLRFLMYKLVDVYDMFDKHVQEGKTEFRTLFLSNHIVDLGPTN